MAQDDRRPRQHYRHSSRIVKSAKPNDGVVKRRRITDEQRQTDGDTQYFIKRILCAHPAPPRSTAEISPNEVYSKSSEELLPPLTSSNEVDIQLYAIIAVILNQFVQSWYNRLTPDHDFVGEVVQIIAHCSRGLEQRLRSVDLEDLLLDELPSLIVTHINILKVAEAGCFNQRSRHDVRMIYHSINPHKALAPLPEDDTTELKQQENEAAWSQLLVSRILPLVLPPEDLRNPCLQVLVQEMFSEILVHNAVCVKASEPWVLWEGVTRIIHSARPDSNPRSSADAITAPINRLENFGLLSSTKAPEDSDLQNTQQLWLDPIAQFMWSMIHFVSIASQLLRSFTIALMQASSFPARHGRVRTLEGVSKVHISAVASDSRPSPQHNILRVDEKRPVISMSIWTCVSRLTAIEERMPWLSGGLSLLQWLALQGPGRVCRTNSVFDRILSSRINARLTRPDLLPSALQAIRGALFPENALAAARVPPTSAETAEMKRECAKTIVNAIPMIVRSRYFGTKDQDLMRQDVERTLDLFGDLYINKHLIISAVELVVARLFPELGDTGFEQ